MKKLTIVMLQLLLLFLFFSEGLSQATDNALLTPGIKITSSLDPNYRPHANFTEAVLFDNGPLVNAPGAGYGGADASVLQTNLSMGTLGFSHGTSQGYRVADDFTIPDFQFSIDSLVFYAYQTGSTTTSTITGIFYQIWNGPPNAPSSQVIYGDLVTNRLIHTTWSHIYRVPDYSLSATDRPIMKNTAAAGIILPPGTYWIDWMVSGSLASGPFAPPITINGQTTTGNALQLTVSTSTWAPINDSGTLTPQGLPFTLYGTRTGNFLVWAHPGLVPGMPSLASADSIYNTLVNSGFAVTLSNDLFIGGPNLNIYNAIFVVLGIYPDNGRILPTDPEGPALEIYLYNGGKIFLEGGDCFNYDVAVGGGYNIQPWFGLNQGSDGSADVYGIIGLNYLSAFNFNYTGSNNFMDELAPASSIPIWQNNQNPNICGVFGSFGSGRAIGVVPSFGGFVNSVEKLNSMFRTAKPDITLMDQLPENTLKPPLPERSNVPVVNKFCYRPELRKDRDINIEFKAGGVGIEANHKEDLMAAYLGLFTLPTTPPQIGVNSNTVNSTLVMGGAEDQFLTISNVGGILAEPLSFSLTQNPTVSWLSVSPLSGMVYRSQPSNVVLSFNTTGLMMGSYNTTLEVTSNDPANPLLIINISLQVNPAPIISISPDTFDITLNVGDSVTQNLTIYNLGPGMLTWQVPGDIPEYFYYQFNENGHTRTPNLASYGSYEFPYADVLGGLSMGNVGLTGAALVGSGGNSSTDYVNTYWVTSLSGSWTISLWIGGTWPTGGSAYYLFGDNTAASFRCFTAGAAGDNNLLLRSPNGNVYDLLLIGVGPGSALVDFVYDDAALQLRGYVNGNLVTTVPQPAPIVLSGTEPFKVGGYGTGFAISAGFLMDDFKIYGRAIDVTKRQLPDWITVVPNYGTVPPGEGAIVQVTFNSSSLLGGDYLGQIVFRNNDPTNPEVEAGVHMKVIGQPVISHSPEPLLMDTTFIGYTDVQTLWVKNTGTDTLRVTDITSTNALFTVDQTQFTVAPPLDSFAVQVTFSPVLAGSFNGLLLIQSNDPVTPGEVVVMTGTSIPAPQIYVTPTHPLVHINVLGDSQAVSIELANNGGSNLEWYAHFYSLDKNRKNSFVSEKQPQFTPPPLQLVQRVDSASPNSAPSAVRLTPGYIHPPAEGRSILYDNGPLVNSPGTGVGGADESIVQTSLGMYGTGWNVQFQQGFSIADDFEVTGESWFIDQITFFVYQTGSTTTSPITGVYYQIWDGYPEDPGSSVIYGDLTTNRLISTSWSNIYRVDEATSGTNTERPIMANIASCGIYLLPGTYWLQWTTDGSYSYTGPWQPSVTINGQTTTGNGIQYYASATTWSQIIDVGPQGFPFIIEGSETDPWIKLLEPTSGTVQPGNIGNLDIRLYSLKVDTTYVGQVEIVSNDPTTPSVIVQVELSTATGISDFSQIPIDFEIAQNYPNPFNPVTSIRYQLPKTSDVRLLIYNVLGQKVRTLVNGQIEAGYHSVMWDGRNDAGEGVASGVYIYRFEAGNFTRTMKLMLLK